MSIQNRRADEVAEGAMFDLSELRELYGESDLHMLLAVALDEFDCQRLLFDAAFGERRWEPAAQALHRLAGTVAFFTGDERALEPLSCLERALRLRQAALVERAAVAARAMLVACRTAFVDALRNAGYTIEAVDTHIARLGGRQ